MKGFKTAVATLQGLDPAVLQAVLATATPNNQIHAAATSTAAAMAGNGSPPTGGEGVVTPGAPSPSLLEPKEMRNLMTGNAATPSTPTNAAQTAAASAGQGRVSFAFPDNPN